MKRLISLLLAMVLLLGLLCGCGKNNDSIEIDKKHIDALKSVEWTAGTVADGFYRNECLNMAFQIPEGWIQASEEETRNILGTDPNDKSTVCDVLLGSWDTSAFMAVLWVDLRQKLGGTSMTEDDFLAETKEDALASPEQDDTTLGEPESVSLCGREYRGMLATIPVISGDITFHTRQTWVLFSRLGKDKMVMLLVRAPEGQLADYMAHFIDDPSTIPAPTVEATPEPTPVFPTASFTRGELNGSSYTSQFLGLRFDAPDGWVFSTDRELAEFMSLDPDELGDAIFNDAEALEKLFAEQRLIYDMTVSNGSTVTDPDSIAVIQIGLENLSFSIGGTSITAEEYAETFVKLLSATDDSYEIGDLEQQELAGKAFVVIPAESDGVYQYSYIARVANYMMTINFAGTDSSVRDYADCFSKF